MDEFERLEMEHGTEYVIRRVQIDALREAREIVDTAVTYYKSDPDNAVLNDDVRCASLEKLDKLIQRLELTSSGHDAA